MARIAEDLIARIKAEVPLEAVVAAAGVELIRRGKDLVARCPFHSPDKEPSLVVTPGKGLWRCFGCNKGGTVIDFRMEISGESFRAAVESLAAAYLPGMTLEESEEKVEPFAPGDVKQWLEASDEELRLRVVDYYRDRLLATRRGKEYLEKRGLFDAAMVGRFGIGFADRTLGLRLPIKQVKAGEALRSRLQGLGILRGDSGHEHLNGSIVIPIRDLSGRIVQLYGRKVTPNLRAGTPRHLYLAASLDCVFNPQALVESDEVILCEAILDALTFWAAGFHHVTCSFGCHNFPPSLLTSMLEHGTRRVLVAYDRDEKSEPPAQELAQQLIGHGIECYRVLFPRGMDANEYAQKVQPASRSLDLVLRKAEWMGTGPPPKRESVAMRTVLAAHVRVPASEPGPASELTGAAPPLDASPSVASVTPDGTTGEPSRATISAAALEDYLDEAADADEVERIASSPLVLAATSPASASVTNSSSALPAPPPAPPPLEVRAHEVVLALADRRYRVRGLEGNLAFGTLRVQLFASRGDGFHVDTLDLYSARQRAAFAKQAASELAIDARLAHHDLGKVFLACEQAQEQAIEKAQVPKETKVVLSAEERAEALKLLASADLVERILGDFGRCGVVGERFNMLAIYFALVSSKLDRPLAVMVQSSSAAGKSAIVEGGLAFMPEEDRIAYSAMTGQSLFYMGGKDLRHKVLSIAEEEGAGRASYALKLFQSEGRVSIASTGRDPATGRLVTHEYTVEGPAAILTTTTAIDVDEEFQNRCLILTVDESREQTEQIHRFQRRGETLEGLRERHERTAILRLHQNAMRLLEPKAIVNPWAEELSYPSTATRTRRDHMKYLALIRAITLLHQYQRKSGTLEVGGKTVPYVETALPDIEIANRLAHEILGRTLDELPPQTQSLLESIHRMVTEACARLAIDRADYRFSRREVREHTGWGNTQLKMHLARLEELEYLLVHRGSRGQSFVYELLYDGEARERERFMMGLFDTGAPGSRGYDGKKSGFETEKSGENGEKSAPSRGQVGPKSGDGRVVLEPMLRVVSGGNGDCAPPRAYLETLDANRSYSQRRNEGNGAASDVDDAGELVGALFGPGARERE